jgi:DNA helicase-2/ATP-dependent DNA helicase PcrA
MSYWLQELNPAQRSAATCGDGPVLVIAGAGTGKTRTLASRVAWLVEQGIPAERILLLTFTRRAAQEMLARAGRLCDPNVAGRVWGGTFHATANRLLRLYGRSLGLPREFTVVDQEDAADFMDLIRSELGLSETGRRFPRKATLAALYSRVVNSRTKLPGVVARWFPWCQEEIEGIRQVFEEYTRRKRAQNVLDYDDLLLYWHALLRLPEVGEKVADRFDQILVDEYQDTNVIQAEILQRMRARRRGIMVVGDDAQSIYSFRAATVRNILDFPAQFPGARVVTLEQNYRSVQPILDASNAVMERARERYTKNLFSRRGGVRRPELVTCGDESEQARDVCERVLSQYEAGVPLRRQAVLFRAGHHSDLLEVELTRRNIPFVKYGGLKFMEAAHVKDLLAFLRLMENPQDELSWFRVLQLLEGVGPAAARKVIAGLWSPAPAAEPAQGLPAPLRNLLRRPPAVPPPAREEFAGLQRTVAECLGLGAGGEAAEPPPAAQIERIRTYYEPLFRRAYENAGVRLRDLDQLEQLAARYRSRGQFLTDLTLDPPNSTQNLAGPPLLDEEFLILSTIHSAKGCEWDSVHILHVADGMIPSDMATSDDEEIEEERRLLYVAMTRARDCLTLYLPLRYYHHPYGRSDRHSYAQLTRFIPDADTRWYDRCGVAAGAAPADEQEATGAPPAESVEQMLNALWSP